MTYTYFVSDTEAFRVGRSAFSVGQRHKVRQGDCCTIWRFYGLHIKFDSADLPTGIELRLNGRRFGKH